ncbi:MAG: HD domain-containing protein [Chlamydiae bacterium]|nr:HD domain-containing protein [Chlamydiota bacterium]
MVTSKKIFDPVHGFIRLSTLEAFLVDSPVFQRLHYIRQLGVTYLVYPGATHTRFEHSLGVMQVASQIFDQIASRLPEDISIDGSIPYWRQILRLAALCHDLGHLPFSHVAEKNLLGKGGHEKWTLYVIESHHLKDLWQMLESEYPGRNPKNDVIKISLGESSIRQIDHPIANECLSDWERVVSQMITGDFFGADRIDYLLRDSRCTGLSYGLFDYQQLIEMLRVLPSNEHSRWELGIEENGVQSCEALLLARHFMHKRVYQYPSVKAYGYHMARFMKYIYDKYNPLESLNEYLSFTDNTILVEAQKEMKKSSDIHPDCLALFDRSKRYVCMEITKELDVQGLQEFLVKKGFCCDHLDFGVNNSNEQRTSTFPVLKKSGTIVDGLDCSRLLIAPYITADVFIPSELHKELNQSTAV